MSNTRLGRIEEIFHRLADADEATRARELAELRRGDAALAAEVESILRAEADDGAPPVSSRLAAAGAGDRLIGAVVGPYRFIERIGEGGFSMVYRAEQHAPVRRMVAIKVLKPGIDSREAIRRFDHERQVLASMDHPDIAHVFDAGRTADGRTFFVMELVDGEPIAAWCMRRKASLDARLDLAIRAARAVQYAHQRGVIHRDLKPGNVLVADPPVPGGPPVVKVIDFGIAKATGAGARQRRSFDTAAGIILGTPEYMSPEQATGESADVDTRSDIYSLGAVLYELLSGATPRAALDTPTAVVRAVSAERHRPPPAPSARARAMSMLPGATQPAVAPDRLRGELDWIVMRCLEPDRARRYATALELVDDIDRWRRRLPVRAGPPGAGYRLRTAARRHRAAIAVAAAFALVLVAATAVSIALMLRAEERRIAAEQASERAAEAERLARDERDAATRARDREAAQRREAERITDLAVEIVSLSGPGSALDPEAPLKSLLDHAARRAEASLADAPVAEARMLMAVGSAYANLGQARRATECLRAAVERLDALQLPMSAEMTESLTTLTYAAQLAGAIELHAITRRSGLQMGSLAGGADASLGLAWERFGAALVVAATPEDPVLAAHRDAWVAELERAARDPMLASIAADMASLGAQFVDILGADRASPSLWATAWRMQADARGPDDPRTLSAAMELALALADRDDPAEAAAFVARNTSPIVQRLGDTHPVSRALRFVEALADARADETRSPEEAVRRADLVARDASGAPGLVERVDALLADELDRRGMVAAAIVRRERIAVSLLGSGRVLPFPAVKACLGPHAPELARFTALFIGSRVGRMTNAAFTDALADAIDAIEGAARTELAGSTVLRAGAAHIILWWARAWGHRVLDPSLVTRLEAVGRSLAEPERARFPLLDGCLLLLEARAMAPGDLAHGSSGAEVLLRRAMDRFAELPDANYLVTRPGEIALSELLHDQGRRDEAAEIAARTHWRSFPHRVVEYGIYEADWRHLASLCAPSAGSGSTSTGWVEALAWVLETTPATGRAGSPSPDFARLCATFATLDDGTAVDRLFESAASSRPPSGAGMRRNDAISAAIEWAGLYVDPPIGGDHRVACRALERLGGEEDPSADRPLTRFMIEVAIADICIAVDDFAMALPHAREAARLSASLRSEAGRLRARARSALITCEIMLGLDDGSGIDALVETYRDHRRLAAIGTESNWTFDRLVRCLRHAGRDETVAAVAAEELARRVGRPANNLDIVDTVARMILRLDGLDPHRYQLALAAAEMGIAEDGLDRGPRFELTRAVALMRLHRDGEAIAALDLLLAASTTPDPVRACALGARAILAARGGDTTGAEALTREAGELIAAATPAEDDLCSCLFVEMSPAGRPRD